jgi:hypothetical protein
MLFLSINIRAARKSSWGQLDVLSENLTINGREYNLDYKEQQQANRTLVVISSQEWDQQDMEMVTKLREQLAQKLAVNSNPQLPRMLFVQKKQTDDTLLPVPIQELKGIIKDCLDEW